MGGSLPAHNWKVERRNMIESVFRARFPHASKSQLRMAAAQFGWGEEPTKGAVIGEALRQRVQGEKRLRQSSKPTMNKLETRFHGKLLAEYPGEAILCQAVRVEISRGHWYKPDFFLPNRVGGPLAYEVKGPFAYRGAFTVLKCAARVHPWIRFILVWEEDMTWHDQIVLA